jgi:hypothetical protein
MSEEASQELKILMNKEKDPAEFEPEPTGRRFVRLR